MTVGITFPSAAGSYRPSKTLPRMPSCRHVSPGRSLPSAARHASLALVPVPHGERSYARPGHSTKLRLWFAPSCGTGTSAKLACLFADGKLKPGDTWRQESVTGSVFEGSVEAGDEPGVVVPSVTGTAYVTAEATLLAADDDPLRDGIRA